MTESKLLVIGSNSFSGSHFISYALNKGHKVWGVSRSSEIESIFLPYKWESLHNNQTILNEENYQFVQIDLNKDIYKLISLIDTVEPDYVVNFASQGMVAESWKEPTNWYQTNVVSQVALHDHLRKKDFLKKYVHVTTPEVYGSTDQGWIKESRNFDPSTPYAVSRAACDMHLYSFFKAYKFPVVFTRAANVFGPGQQLYRIIPRAILSCRTGKPLQLHGGGHSIRSFIHIEDVARATLELAFRAEPGSCWHISTKKAISIRDLVEKICQITNVDFKDIVRVEEERLGKDQSYLLDSTAIRKSFGWEDEVDLDKGLRETLLWIDNNLTQLQGLPWHYIHKA